MADFIPLRDFLLLSDIYDRECPRPFLRNEQLASEKGLSNAQDAVLRYDLAKASFETYGQDGPPVGSKVTTLVSGHGGGVGCVRTFGGVLADDPRCFFLTREDGSKSLVTRAYWWAEILPGVHVFRDRRGGLVHDFRKAIWDAEMERRKPKAHTWPQVSEGHECSYVDCWCEHCEACGVDRSAPEADKPCPGSSS